jgi:hypothetical protein
VPRDQPVTAGLANASSRNVDIVIVSRSRPGSAAASAVDLAVLTRRQPNLGPVALRALYAHSARWPSATFDQFEDRKGRLRAVGYQGNVDPTRL